MTETEGLILSEIREIKTDIRSLFSKLNSTDKNAAVASNELESAIEHAKKREEICAAHHADDNKIGKMIITESVKFGVLLALAIFAMKIGLK